jgi:hypothetical protein
MTWDDYAPIPRTDWANMTLIPERGFKIALVAVDFPDQPFVITLPKGSDLFGNPRIDPISREEVPGFYADFWIKPSEINNGQTINGYWMEQSRGRFGITELTPYDPYRMSKGLRKYGLSEHWQYECTPCGFVANSRINPDIDSPWRADAGDIEINFDAVLRVYACYDGPGFFQRASIKDINRIKFIKNAQ